MRLFRACMNSIERRRYVRNVGRSEGTEGVKVVERHEERDGRAVVVDHVLKQEEIDEATEVEEQCEEVAVAGASSCGRALAMTGHALLNRG
jgi:hypothetical protein